VRGWIGSARKGTSRGMRTSLGYGRVLSAYHSSAASNCHGNPILALEGIEDRLHTVNEWDTIAACRFNIRLVLLLNILDCSLI